MGDALENVQANRHLLKKTLNFGLLLSSRQVHGNKIALINELPTEDQELDGFDVMITNLPDLGLMIQQADCQAVALYDPVMQVVGNVHCGWRGSVQNIIARTILQMVGEFGSSPADISAAISPSLGPCCAEFVNYTKELPEKFMSYQVKANYFDFWAISRDQLMQTGVLLANIHIAGICTACNRDFFSYRRDGITGRGATVIGLR